ncbi:PI-PLC X domain-containing protein 3 isoform X3 [Tribolium madens]|nr:PI-PLC X domain-containing protein 3 isoform X3 [Tribolium madens]
MTYGITKDSEVSPDAEPILQQLKFLGPLLTTFMERWSKTQAATATQQLKLGIRYFDLRIATKENSEKFYFVHGLYSGEVGAILDEIKAFLDTHPFEVVILDCQHFYAFEQPHHERFMQLLTAVFGHKLLPYMDHMDHISLQYMTNECRYQAIVVYRSDAARFGQPLLWPSGCFPTPWANTDSIPELIAFLNDTLKQRDPQMGYISQCILTPSTCFVLTHLFSTLKEQCFLPLEGEKHKWLNGKIPGPGGVNIIISDFVDYEEGAFSSRGNGILDDQLAPKPARASTHSSGNSRLSRQHDFCHNKKIENIARCP